MTGSLFGTPPTGKPRKKREDAPLPERLRPETLEALVGLEDLLGPGRFLRNAIETDRIPSMIFWGPPGSGKTTLARIIATTTRAQFVTFSATSSSIKEIRALMEDARRDHESAGNRTIVFIDEIHRFNKAQQDAFLPYVEAGHIVLIGATTENPSFEVNSALLSRSKVVVLPALERPQILTILERAITDPTVSRFGITIDPTALDFMAATSAGDARQALNSLQLVVETATKADGPIDAAKVKEMLQRRSLMYDKSGDQHYGIISALHKSMRNGDADASVYWLARMLEGGEDPMYLARRLVRAAAEDVGNADPQALILAVAVKDAVHFLGMPEAGVVLAQLVTYIAAAPKSNAAYLGYGEAVHEVRNGDNPPVPLHIRAAPTKLMKQLGYGAGYEYAHDFEEQTTAMNCLPDSIANKRFYEPKEIGAEKEMKERLEKMRTARKKLRE